MYMQENDQQEVSAMCHYSNWLYECHEESHSIIKTLHSFGKGKTLKVIKIVRKLQWTQEPQDIPTCTGTTLSVSNLLLFFSQNLGGRWFTVCIVTNQKLKQQAMKYYDQGFQAAIYIHAVNVRLLNYEYRYVAGQLWLNFLIITSFRTVTTKK